MPGVRALADLRFPRQHGQVLGPGGWEGPVHYHEPQEGRARPSHPSQGVHLPYRGSRQPQSVPVSLGQIPPQLLRSQCHRQCHCYQSRRQCHGQCGRQRIPLLLGLEQWLQLPADPLSSLARQYFSRGRHIRRHLRQVREQVIPINNSRLITAECDKTIKIWKRDPTATPETHPIDDIRIPFDNN